MDVVKLNISGLHADALSIHIIVLLKNYLDVKKPSQITPEQMDTLKNLDLAYQKFKALTEVDDDETPQEIQFTLTEAEALILAFTDQAYITLIEQDPFYQDHAFSEYFGQIYSPYLEEISAGYMAGMEE